MSRAEVAVVVLQWGHADETLRCLAALRRSQGASFEILVVDNFSAERDAPDRVRQAFPGVRVIQNPRNLGFAGGNNVALRELLARPESLRPRWAFLLNNDVELEPDCLARMVTAARRTGAGAVGALNLVRGTSAVGSSGGRVRWPSAHYEDQGRAARQNGVDVHEVETVSGSTLLLDLAALAEVGVFDEAYFCVYEETDLCQRLRNAGWRLVLVPGAVAHHAVGASTGRKVHFYFRFRNRFRFARAHGGSGAVGRMLPSLLGAVAWKTALYSLALRWGDLAGVLRGVLDGVRGVAGPGPYVRS